MPASRNTRFRRILQLALVALLLIGALSQAYRFIPDAPREAMQFQIYSCCCSR